jgi:hypothetical protein
MKKLFFLLRVLFFALISCEEYEDDLFVSVNIQINACHHIDTIITGIPDMPLLLSESKRIDEFCSIRTFYQNQNEDVSYNEGIDHFIGRDTICDGVSGQNGQDGENGSNGKDAPSPKFRFEKFYLDNLCNVYFLYIDDVLFLQDTLCSGSQGPKGNSDTVVKIEMVWIYDTITDIISKIDTLFISDSVFIITNTYDTVYHFDSIFIFSRDTIFKIDSIFVTDNDTIQSFKETVIKEGPIKFFPCDTIWFDNLFSDKDFIINNMDFKSGSRLGATLKIFGKNVFGEVVFLSEFYSDPVTCFSYNDDSEYIRYFNSPIDNVFGFSSIGILAKYSKKPKCIDDYLYIMNLRISAVK